ncbi:hypothetical protein RUM44_012867 [Polyplax serrata]|uniref:Cilia- and flagella-associated protein 157 n=1 Tax=Polyplax serrata TaxID=468196 RepID=A0ABR1BCI4_POLSC
MGPKKDKAKVEIPEPTDEATELERQVFLIQLEDIGKKIIRLTARQEELNEKTVELEEKIEECKKENGVVIAEQEQSLILKEEEKIKRREENIRLHKELREREDKHKKHIELLEKKYDDMVKEKTKDLAALKQQAVILEEFKQNKDVYASTLEKYEKHLIDAEVEHQRMLFNIERKGEVVKARLKKELESRLLNLSIEFQEVYQKQIGDSCHRMTLENKAIESELMMMSDELAEYRQEYANSVAYVEYYKTQTGTRKLDKDKALARTTLQKIIIEALMRDRMNVLLKLNEYAGLEVENKNYIKKLKSVETEKERQIVKTCELNKLIEDKIEVTENLKDATVLVRKLIRKLQVLVRNALKIVEEAVVVRLIPAGGMEEEKFLTNEAKIRLFKKRRESVFQRKGKILQYLLDFLAKAQFTEDEISLLKISSTETINLEAIDFTVIYGRTGATTEKEIEHKESLDGLSEVLGYRLASDASLPRSVSEIIGQDTEEEYEEEEEEFEGEEEEREDIKEDFKQPPDSLEDEGEELEDDGECSEESGSMSEG